MWMMYLIWILLALPLVALTVWVYRLAARKNRVFAAVLAIVTLSVSLLIWPIPIHGGFTFVAEIIYHEWWGQNRLREQARVEQEKRKFVNERTDRFTGVIEYEIQRPLANGWFEVVTADGEHAWFNETHKLVWSATLVLESTDTSPPLALAKARCQQLVPSSRWVLASEAENVLWWQSKGDEVLGKSTYSMVSYIADEDLQIELPTYALKKRAAAGQSSSRASFAVRCVARTSAAPAGGYGKKDLPLELWNAYQLSKMAP